MMKFILVGLASLIMLFLGGLSSVWLIILVLIISMFLFILGGYSSIVDYIYFSDFMGGDVLSYSLVVLSFWVTMMMYYGSVSSVQSNIIYFNLFVFVLMYVLLVTFYVTNLLSFYFFFEASLIPTLLIIMGWGYQPERLQAGLYFLFYTLLASLPLLSVIMISYKELGSLDLWVFVSQASFLGSFLGVFYLLAFLVKLPMYFVHLWLPKAHVEAPVAGSMILAGVLLKLGGYGLIRVFPLCMKLFQGFSGYFYGLSILGMSYVGFMCCRLNDLKALVAYSSVAHMALVLCGCFSMGLGGYSGSLMMMVSHGVSSSGLFCMVNMYYERSGSRSFFLNKGLILLFPIFTLFFFLMCASNMAAPPTINLLSEIFLMISILKFDWFMLLMFPLGSFMGAVFTVFMFSYSQHGSSFLGEYSSLCPSFREFHCLMMHVVPLNFLILKSESFLMMF